MIGVINAGVSLTRPPVLRIFDALALPSFYPPACAMHVTTLRQAADEINVTMVKTVTDQFRAQDRLLAGAIDELTDSYRFDQLQALLKQVEL